MLNVYNKVLYLQIVIEKKKKKSQHILNQWATSYIYHTTGVIQKSGQAAVITVNSRNNTMELFSESVCLSACIFSPYGSLMICYAFCIQMLLQY